MLSISRRPSPSLLLLFCALLLGVSGLLAARRQALTRLAPSAAPMAGNRPPTAAPTIEPAPGEHNARKLCDLGDERLDESSGLAASRRYPGFLWTHNDSGDGPRLFLVGATGRTCGKTVAIVTLQGARALDWEDMAIAGTGDNVWAYAGDIGDNARRRADIVVYRFREPSLQVRQSAGAAPALRLPCERLTLRYPDGAHDAEALLATADGHLLLVTKSPETSLVFMTPQPFAAGATQTLERIGEVRIERESWLSRLVTGGDLSPDGRRLVLRTYTEAHEWMLSAMPGTAMPVAGTPGAKTAARSAAAPAARGAARPAGGAPAGGTKPKTGVQPADNAKRAPWRKVWSVAPRSRMLPPMRQGEAICYSADGQRWFVTSEQLPAPLYEVELNGGGAKRK